MSVKFNPFTCDFDFVGSGGGTVEGYTQDFVIADWSSGAGFYFIDIQHNLETLDFNYSIFEGTTPVMPDRIEALNTNTIRLYAPLEPDCRFNGKINILQV